MHPLLTLLDPKTLDFPPVEQAFEEPNGLLALGGDLSTKRLLKAYQSGIFPWYEPEQPILWWSPNPRCVLFPNEIHISRSLGKFLRKTPFTVSTNKAFERVIRKCRTLRVHSEGTWIHEDMINAYCRLHTSGYAHSIEVWNQQQLVGGLYGIALWPCFFGESMFSTEANASKVALISLCNHLRQADYRVIDCQVENDHLLSMGARCIPRKDFLSFLDTLVITTDTQWLVGSLSD